MNLEKIRSWFESLDSRGKARVIAASGVLCLGVIFAMNSAWSAIRGDQRLPSQQIIPTSQTDSSDRNALVVNLLKQLKAQQNITPPNTVQNEGKSQPKVTKKPQAIVPTEAIRTRKPATSPPTQRAASQLLSILQKHRRWRGTIVSPDDHDTRPAAPLELEILKLEEKTRNVFLRLKRTDLVGVHTDWSGRLTKSGQLIADKTAWSRNANITREGAFYAIRPANLSTLSMEYLNARLEGGTAYDRIVLDTAIVAEEIAPPEVQKQAVKKKSRSRKDRLKLIRQRNKGKK